MMTSDTSIPDIMNVREIIDTAFGDYDGNAVNFKLIQTVLFLFARQLRLLERRVKVEFGPLAPVPTGSTLSITEVKIHAMGKKPKKKKGEGDKNAAGIKTGSRKGRKSGTGRASVVTSSSDKTSTDKTSTDKTSTDKTSTDKTSTDKTSTDKSSTYKTSTDNTSTDKASTDKASTDKTFTGKSSTDKTSTDKTSTDITSTDKTSTYKTSTDITFTNKTFTDKTSKDKTFTDKTSTDQSSTDKTTTEKTSTGITSKDKTSTDKTSTDKTLTDKSSSSKTRSSNKDETMAKSTSEQYKSPPKESPLGTFRGKANQQPPADRQAASDKTSSNGPTDRTSSKSAGEPSPKRGKPYSDPNILKTLEERKELELRIIHQRANSFEEAAESPTPMASVRSMEAVYEKILVVERVPSSESRKSASMQGQGRTPQISVVTKEQFEHLAKAVRELQNRLLPIGTAGFSENAELMKEIRRGASLTDAMAALQLSARLEATEKAIEQMTSMFTELARQTPGVDLNIDTQASRASRTGARFRFPRDTQGSTFGTPGAPHGGKGSAGPGIAFESDGIGSQKSPDMKRKTPIYSQPSPRSPEQEATSTFITSEITTEASKITTSQIVVKTIEDIPAAENEYAIKPDYITYEDLESATRTLYHNVMNAVTAITTRTTKNADNAYKLAINLEGKIETAINVGSQMANLEYLVTQYAEQINALDTGLSSQMTTYQEQLTQMQHDLETGLETMAEVLGNTGGDTVAMAELNSHFNNLQIDFESMLSQQRDLKEAQDAIAFDLESLWIQIEMLRDTKSDREEVADALRDKAGIGELNGLVPIQQFDAVRGDFEKRIVASFNKFNNQELVWQKAIIDLETSLKEKVDIIQVESLRDEINKYLNIMKGRIQILVDIVGEPKSAMLSKKLFRNTACLACGNPAHMDIEEPNTIPALPKFRSTRQPGEGAEAESRPTGDGDHGVCYSGLVIPHPRDPRSHVCQRYCGGSHTLVNEGPCRVPPGMVINPVLRQVTTELGTDGKMYLVDTQPKEIPCLACNMPKPSTPPPSEPEQYTVKMAQDGTTPPLDSTLTRNDFLSNMY